MLTRRFLLTSTAAMAALLTAARFVPPAFAQSADQARSFVQQTASQIVGIVNGNAPAGQKEAELRQIVDQTVAIDDIARFCLGRYWRSATPQQQQQYLELFRRVLFLNITSKIGEYKGVTVNLGNAADREGAVAVTSTVNRPGNAPARVDWIVGNEQGAPKIIDVVAEGTSLRLTQRNDYSSFLARNNSNVQALIDAMRKQAS